MEIGAIRFVTAGTILLAYCKIKGLEILHWHQVKIAVLSGLLLLFIDNGLFIWAEQYVPSSLAAIMASSVSLWFILLDKRKWQENLRNRYIILGLILGVIGILFLFGEQLFSFFSGNIGKPQIIALLVLAIAPSTWALGSLYSKYNTAKNENIWVSIGWQMFAAGIAFSLGGIINGDFKSMNWQTIPKESIASVIYLIFFGSLAAYSSYIWLLKVRSAMQVSTHAYVNPVIAVLLGCLFGHEFISFFQIIGLIIILLSVLSINMSSIWIKRKARNTQ